MLSFVLSLAASALLAPSFLRDEGEGEGADGTALFRALRRYL